MVVRRTGIKPFGKPLASLQRSLLNPAFFSPPLCAHKQGQNNPIKGVCNGLKSGRPKMAQGEKGWTKA
jgi:hypothetical protein